MCVVADRCGLDISMAIHHCNAQRNLFLCFIFCFLISLVSSHFLTGICGLWCLVLRKIEAGQGIMLGYLNSLVHAVMYTYYLLSIWMPSVKTSKLIKRNITRLQMVRHYANWLCNKCFVCVCVMCRGWRRLQNIKRQTNSCGGMNELRLIADTCYLIVSSRVESTVYVESYFHRNDYPLHTVHFVRCIHVNEQRASTANQANHIGNLSVAVSICNSFHWNEIKYTSHVDVENFQLIFAAVWVLAVRIWCVGVGIGIALPLKMPPKCEDFAMHSIWLHMNFIYLLVEIKRLIHFESINFALSLFCSSNSAIWSFISAMDFSSPRTNAIIREYCRSWASHKTSSWSFCSLISIQEHTENVPNQSSSSRINAFSPIVFSIFYFFILNICVSAVAANYGKILANGDDDNDKDDDDGSTCTCLLCIVYARAFAFIIWRLTFDCHVFQLSISWNKI